MLKKWMIYHSKLLLQFQDQMFFNSVISLKIFVSPMGIIKSKKNCLEVSQSENNFSSINSVILLEKKWLIVDIKKVKKKLKNLKIH